MVAVLPAADRSGHEVQSTRRLFSRLQSPPGPPWAPPGELLWPSETCVLGLSFRVAAAPFPLTHSN